MAKPVSEVRMHIELDGDQEPLGWVTSAREGADFLISETSGRTSSLVKQMKFKFFPHQVKMATVDCVHFS